MEQPRTIKMIPTEEIYILNPRTRGRNVFQAIRENIATIGLKRPITVTPTKNKGRNYNYDLVCGQGRLEVYKECEQMKIPAIVLDVTEEKALIMSLVENLARRQHRPLELLQGIETLKQSGNDSKTIAEKTGLKSNYVRAILTLIDKGEERLLSAVEAGQIPVTIAVAIARSPDNEHGALQEAYMNNELRGKKLAIVKSILRKRHELGKKLNSAKLKSSFAPSKSKSTSQQMVEIYQKDVDRKKFMTKKANLVRNKMAFLVAAFEELLNESYNRKWCMSS